MILRVIKFSSFLFKTVDINILRRTKVFTIYTSPTKKSSYFIPCISIGLSIEFVVIGVRRSLYDVS